MDYDFVISLNNSLNFELGDVIKINNILCEVKEKKHNISSPLYEKDRYEYCLKKFNFKADDIKVDDNNFIFTDKNYIKKLVREEIKDILNNI